jgi:hypothetical protein
MNAWRRIVRRSNLRERELVQMAGRRMSAQMRAVVEIAAAERARVQLARQALQALKEG